MSIPETNSSLKISIPFLMASLKTGSPILEVTPLSHERGLPVIVLSSSTTCSARNNPKVVALTKIEGELFRCSSHFFPPIFSSMISSQVWLSGIRKRDSARHIRATPS